MSRLRAWIDGRLARRTQQGYVLAVVLAAMVVGLTLITALLGLSFATQSSAIAQQRLAREQRAADGALEVGVEMLRSSPDPAALCDASGDLVSPTMQVSSNASAADEPVKVTCESGASTLNAVGKLTVLSGETDALNHQSDPSLPLVGDVDVVGGATFGTTSTGAEVKAGTYTQGKPCDSWFDGQKWLLSDADGEGNAPTCGADMSGVDIPVAHVNPPVNAGTVSACGANGATVTAGYFDRKAVDALQGVLDTCALVQFLPGSDGAPTAVFFFDAGAQGALMFRNAGASYVFGDVLNGSSPAVCDPGSQNHLQVVLGGGTGIDHTNGALTMCGGGNDGPTLLQTDTADTQPSLTFTGTKTGTWTNPGDTLSPWDATKPLHGGGQATYRQGLPFPSVTYTVHSAGVGDISSLALEWKTQEAPPTLVNYERQMWVTFSGTANFQCVSSLRGRVAGGMGLRFEFPMGSQVGCTPPAPLTGAALDGSKMKVEFRTFCDALPCFDATGDIADLHLVTNTKEYRSLPEVVDSDGWINPGNLSGDTSSAIEASDCVEITDFVCDWRSLPSPDPASLVMTFPDGVQADDADIGRLTLALDTKILGANSPGSFEDVVADPSSPGNPRTDVVLEWGGTTCPISLNSYAISRGTQFIDLTECAAGRRLSDVPFLKLRLEFSPETLSVKTDLAGNPYWAQEGVKLPPFTRAQLLTTPRRSIRRQRLPLP